LSSKFGTKFLDENDGMIFFQKNYDDIFSEKL